MNYIIDNPSALVEQRNLTLSPFSNKYPNQISAFSFDDVIGFFKGDGKSESETDSGDGSGGELPYVFGTIGNIVGVLPQLGIGSKSRINETRAIADANTQVLNAQLAAAKLNQEQIDEQYKDKKELLIIGGSFLLVILIVLFTLKS
jgi:hypothetical protein